MMNAMILNLLHRKCHVKGQLHKPGQSLPLMVQTGLLGGKILETNFSLCQIFIRNLLK